ncbi:STAS domain-containing protein [Micromonospora sp. AMSO31t]|uniref:STAS domain-containing protein n=1 Tax=Micromonospora sp. AMSO31t TaxID=2650566 RepID=UPI00124BC294|nr:STAS domain-containing protein [Micromonospora sp. AMSO31t]KAB1913584.1 hypothetical protein F8274_09980 [Micromonospora sp. AMSO31t]
MILLNFGIRLNARSWVDTLRAHADGFSGASFAPGAMFGQHIVVDLSEVGFADFVTLGHLLNFLRAMTNAGAQFSVVPPQPEALAHESPQDAATGMRRLARRNCQLYLEQTGFQAAYAEMDGQVEFEAPDGAERLSPIMNGSQRSDGGESGQLPKRRRRILPYRWVNVGEARGLTESDDASRWVADLKDLGLSDEQAAAFGAGIIAELLENAAEHSGLRDHDGELTCRRQILLGGVIVPPETYKDRGGDLDESIRDLVTWAAKVPSPLVRLVVADAGAGMISALAAANSAEVEFDPEEAQQAILTTLDRRPPTRKPTGLSDHHAGGLWKVARLARGYQGGLVITSSGQLVTRVFGQSSEPHDLARTCTVVTAGTLVECDMLLQPDDEAQLGAEEVITPPRTTGREDGRPDLDCVTVSLRRRRGLTEEDLHNIRRQLGRRPTATGGLVVAVTAPDSEVRPDDVDIGTAIAQVLRLANAPGDLATVVLALPGVNRQMMSVAVEFLNAECGPGAGNVPPDMRSPVLVLGPDNRHFWIGGTASGREILRRLSAAQHPMHLHDLATGGRNLADALPAVRELQDRTGLLHAENDALRLRIKPQDAMSALASYVGQELRNAIENNTTEGVVEGVFLTPNLEVASRWCHLGRILAGLNLSGLAGYALAARMEDRIGRFNRAAAPLVVRVGDAPHAMVAAFARSFTGHDSYADSLEDVRLERARRGTEGAAQVLLVTDLVSSRRTLKHALLQLVDRDMVPLAVAAGVDTGMTDDTSEAGEVLFLNRRVPMIKLSDVDVQVDTPLPRQPDPIDPVLRQPMTGTRTIPKALVTQDAYVAAMERSNAARLGHIERPANRHYTAYVDPTRLFRQRDWAETVNRLLVKRVTEMHHATFGDEAEPSAACVLYPEGTLDDLPRVAEALGAALVRAGIPVIATLGIPRAPVGEWWWYPGSVSLPAEARHAVIVDAGAGSARTIGHLQRIAATGGIAAITGFLLLNGLTGDDALVLHQTRTVSRSNDRSRSDSIPVALHYVARTAMSGLGRGVCDICTLRRAYQESAMLVPIPIKLEAHRDWLLRLLEPRSKRAAFEEQATDLFGAHVGPRDCTEYLRWRYELREADLDTLQRREVNRKLVGARQQPIIRDALVRLLVAEAHWLRSAPLWFPECQSTVADLALMLLVGESAPSADAMLRVQAVILLARVSAITFADQLSRILHKNQHDEPVVLQTMLEALRLVAATRSPNRYSRDLVIHPIVQRLVRLEDELRGARADSAQDTSVLSRNLVRYVLSHGQRTVAPEPADRQTAWAALREHRRSVADHDYENAMWRVIQTVTLIGRGRRPEDLDGMREDWEVCSNFLNLDVLPNIHLLRNALLTRDTALRLGRDDADRFAEVVNAAPGRSALDETTVQLDALIDRVRASVGRAPHDVDQLLRDLQWWYDFFLPASGAGIHKVVDRCPTDLLRILRNTFPDQQAQAAPEEQLPVFCSERIVKDVFTHIQMNAVKVHRVGDGDQRIEVIVEDRSAGHVTVSVRNDGSRPTGRGGGRGLSSLADELAAFGAHLQPARPAVDWASYCVEVTFERWRLST